MNGMYKIEIKKEVMKSQMKKLSSSVQSRIKFTIIKKLSENPKIFGKPLKFSLSGKYSLRVGDYRIIYTIDEDNHIVYIDEITHRSEAYLKSLLIF